MKKWGPQEWAVVVAENPNRTEPSIETLRTAGNASKCDVNFIGHAYENGVAVAVSGKCGCTDRLLQRLKALNIKAQSYSHYQELRITLNVPTGLSAATSLLVLNADTAKVIRELERRCGQPRIRSQAETQTWTFNYCGQRILHYRQNGKRQFVNRDFDFGDGLVKAPSDLATLILREYSA